MDFQLTDAQFARFLEESRDEIEQAMLGSLRERLSWMVVSVLKSELEPVVREFCANEIVPAVAEQLAGAKSEIIAAVVGETQIVGTEFARGLAKTVAEKLGSDYQRRDFFKALFG